jgi:hypothetical protein
MAVASWGALYRRNALCLRNADLTAHVGALSPTTTETPSSLSQMALDLI